MLKVATLFSGIGTPEQSLKHLQVEHETVFACEWDKYARITYLTNNQAPGNFYEDVKTLDATKYKDQVDILIAGFPCQAFSIAGKQLGFEDTRGTYFFDTAKAVRECNPKVFVFENVEGLISNDKPKTPNCLFKTYTWKENRESNQNVFFNHNFLLERIYDKKEKIHKYIFKDKIGVFIDKVFHSKGYPSHFNKSYDGHKKGIGKTLYTMEKVMLDLGYRSITWDVVNTKDYGIPQNRSRIYIVGFKDNVNFHFQEKQELKLRLKDMLEDYVDEKYLLSQELVSKYLETGTASNHKGSQAGKVADENDETFWTVNAGTHGYSMGYVKIAHPAREVGRRLDENGKRCDDNKDIPITRRYEIGEKEISNCLSGVQKDSYVAIANGVIEIENDEVRVREAVAKGFTLATEGDSINISVPSSKTRRGRVGKQVAQTLDTACNQVVFKKIINWYEKENKDMEDGDIIQEGHTNMKGERIYKTNIHPCLPAERPRTYTLNNYIFRKLTPRECFRLQGFDDSFIFAPKMSDSQLYKQAGNGMSRNILDMIFTQIFTCYAKHIENIKE